MNTLIQDRIAGLEYREIAAKHGVSQFMVRYHCRRAMKRGEVTPEQIGYKPATKKRPHSPPYHRLYERLVARIRKDENGCWLWTGPVRSTKWPQNRYGYIGGVWNGAKHKTLHTHRAMMIALHGPLTKEQVICHRCDVPLCINPDHLFVGTMADNIRDSRAKNRHHEAKKTHCDKGHPLSGDNLKVMEQGGMRNGKPRAGIRRVCKACQEEIHKKPSYIAWRREYQRKRRAAKRAAPSAGDSNG